MVIACPQLRCDFCINMLDSHKRNVCVCWMSHVSLEVLSDPSASPRFAAVWATAD